MTRELVALLLLVMVSLMGLVGGTNTVKMERMTDKTEESTGRLATSVVVEADNNWPLSDDFKAILGGVLGFWGGVGSMGTVFLLVVMTQRYCCRRRMDKEETGERSY